MKNLDAGTKKMLKTFGTLVGVLLVLFIILFIFMGLAGKKVGDTQLLNTVENAAKRYYANNKESLPKLEGETVKVSTDTLIAEKYLKSFDKITKNTSCSGEVKVTNNGGEYLYTPSLKCSEYKTTTIASKIEETLVSSGDGLYKDGNKYYYRGEYVNNYIKIGPVTYRIVSIDGNGYMKLMNPVLGKTSYLWDDRYNVEKNQSGLGVNDYEKSRLRENLSNSYADLDTNTKKYIVKYDWCAGRRSSDVINDEECLVKIKDYVGTITPAEYAFASLDENCKNIYSGSCSNYNYFSKLFTKNSWTMTGVDSSSYEVVYVTSSGLDTKKTSGSARIAPFFNIDGNNVYVSGDGTEKNPYTIR